MNDRPPMPPESAGKDDALPGETASLRAAAATSFYRVRWRGREEGPWTRGQIEQKLADREISAWHEVWVNARWVTVQELLATHPADAPPRRVPAPAARAGTVAAAAPSFPLPSKRRLVFVLLGLMAGFTGAHNCYVRRWGVAALQMAFSATSLSLGFGIIFPWLWAMTETLVVSRDARGVPLL